MNLYLSPSASARSHLRLHFSRLPPFPATVHRSYPQQCWMTQKVTSRFFRLPLSPSRYNNLLLSTSSWHHSHDTESHIRPHILREAQLVMGKA